jgi:hypothetical protein
MNVNRMQRSAGSKLILGLVMAICFVVAPIHAQPRVAHFKGTFVLTHDIQWGKALLRPGTYSLAVDSVDATTESICVYDIATGKMVVGEMAAISFTTSADDSQILIAVRGNQRAVASVQLDGMGEVLDHANPFAASESGSEEARSIQSIPIDSAKK